MQARALWLLTLAAPACDGAARPAPVTPAPVTPTPITAPTPTPIAPPPMHPPTHSAAVTVFPCNRVNFLRRASADTLRMPGEYIDPVAPQVLEILRAATRP